MNKAFTLVELLVVIGIMGLLGTVSVGGYRAMQRGMEERGVMENANALAKAAFERAQIDRQPTLIYFWNETLRSSDDDNSETVVGRAVAVRRYGRLSAPISADNLIIDEYADLEKAYPPNDNNSGTEDKVNTMFLYNLDDLNAGASRKFSIVSSQAELCKVSENIYPHGKPVDSVGSGEMETYGLRLVEENNVGWKVGSSYGFEFAEITLPKNYIFGTTYSIQTEDPVREAGAMVFKVGFNNGNGVTGASSVEGSMTVYSLRPNSSGMLTAQKVATIDTPN